MASAKRRMAGSTFQIGTTATLGSSDTYVTITGCKQIGGDLGGTFQVADTTDLDDTTKQETKTLLDPGQVDLEFHEVVSDTGQANLLTAFNSTGDVPYNFQVNYPNGDKRRFKAKVMSYQPQGGNSAGIRTIRSRLSLTDIATYVP